jgi:hypothetical protein
VVNDGYIIIDYITMAGWCFQPTPLKNDGVKVSWDDSIFPIYDGKIKNNVPNHQPVNG